MNKFIIFLFALFLGISSHLFCMEQKEEQSQFIPMEYSKDIEMSDGREKIELPLEGPITNISHELILHIIDNLFPNNFCNATQILTSITDALQFVATSQQFRNFLPEIAVLAKKHAENNEVLKEALEVVLFDRDHKVLGSISMLLQTGIDPHEYESNLSSIAEKLLHKAIKSCQNENVKFVFSWVNKLPVNNESKKNIIKEMINFRSRYGETALMLAAKKNNLLGLQLLLDEADKNKLRKKVLKVQDHYNYTPLHHIVFSISAEHTNGAVYLLFNKINSKLRKWLLLTGSHRDNYRIPLYWAIEQKKLDTIALLSNEAKKDMVLWDELLSIKDEYGRCTLKSIAKEHKYLCL